MTETKISPLAPSKFPDLPAIPGFKMAVAKAGVRYKGRTDLWVLRAAPGTHIAGVFTQSRAPGAPVIWSRKALTARCDPKDPRLIIVNSGTANVFVGAKGKAAVETTAKGACYVFGGTPEAVFLASTGVIGEPLDASKLTDQFPLMQSRLSADIWLEAAKAIMTTDTYPKVASVKTRIDGHSVTINGIAKGSGMIAPDMATMLGFIATDAAISQAVLQTLLSEAVQTSFNAITVDSDTSTSDTVLLAASGKALHELITDISDSRLEDFKTALSELALNLAHQIVKDGEGASKFVEISVTGAESDASARTIAMSVANSPLVKTAIAGEDANWGRLVMAVGKSGEPVDRDKLSIWMGDHLLAEQGTVAADYEEAIGARYMRQSHLKFRLDIGLGEGDFTAWTCDLTHGYIDINADYRS